MYSESIIDRNLSKAKKRSPFKIERLLPDTSITRAKNIELLWDQKAGKLLRELSDSESEFIKSEMVLCRYDFRYWASRYCNPPEAPIWMLDGSFKNLGDVEIGDTVVGWELTDTTPPQKERTYRITQKEKFVPSTVIAIQKRRAPLVELTMESGRKIRCTPDHWWSNGATTKSWTPWVQPRIGATLRRFIDMDIATYNPLTEGEAGWLSGMFDGEGSCSHQSSLCISQDVLHNPDVCDEISRLLTKLCIPHSAYDDKFYFTGGKSQFIKFLNVTKPVRGAKILSRILGFCRGERDRIVRITPCNDSTVISMQTTTGNYVAWGYASKNCTIQLDANVGGGMSPPKLWATQEHALQLLAEREVEMWEQYDKEKFCDGIIAAYHKARQQGLTALCCGLKMHRMVFYTNTRALGATLAMPNDSSKLELYNRDQIILNNLPFWMRPRILYDVKGEQVQFDGLGSKMIYTDSEQRSGIGTGAQWDVHQITECGLWDNLLRLMFELMPGVPKSPFVLGAWESTANGRVGPGEDWMTLTENIRHKRRGWEHWVYCFIPWYMEPTKYRRPVPTNWTPSEIVIKHAEMVEKTSPEFNSGVTRSLTRPQMYWWESEHELYRSLNKLNQFLTNYCATPEESFQHSVAGALPCEVIERMHHEATIWGMPYDCHFKEMVKI